MDFDLTEEHVIFRDAVRDFCEKEIAPLVDEAEETNVFPKQLFKQMGALGFLCPRYPIELGGGGARANLPIDDITVGSANERQCGSTGKEVLTRPLALEPTGVLCRNVDPSPVANRQVPRAIRRDDQGHPDQLVQADQRSKRAVRRPPPVVLRAAVFGVGSSRRWCNVQLLF